MAAVHSEACRRRLGDLVDRPAWKTARGGWKPKGRDRLRRQTVDKMLREGLVSQTTLGGHAAIVITDLGRAVAAAVGHNKSVAGSGEARSRDHHPRSSVEAAPRSTPLVRAWWLE